MSHKALYQTRGLNSQPSLATLAKGWNWEEFPENDREWQFQPEQQEMDLPADFFCQTRAANPSWTGTHRSLALPCANSFFILFPIFNYKRFSKKATKTQPGRGANGQCVEIFKNNPIPGQQLKSSQSYQVSVVPRNIVDTCSNKKVTIEIHSSY